MSKSVEGCPSCRRRGVICCPHVRYAVRVGGVTVCAYRYRPSADAAARSWTPRPVWVGDSYATPRGVASVVDRREERLARAAASETVATLDPVKLSGWYERTDGTVGLYTWRAGRLDLDEVATSWAAVPTREERLARDAASGA